MKNKFPLLISPIFWIFCASGQNFSGQWKGEFIDKSAAIGNFSGDKCEYVLELDVDGKNVSGSTYTYFSEGGKRYYTICKLEGRIDSKKKYIEIEEVSRIKTNIPSNIRNCFQTHRLTYFKKGDSETLEGSWSPAPQQAPGCGFGSTMLSKRTLSNSFTNRTGTKKKNEPSDYNDNTVSRTNHKPGKNPQSGENKHAEITESKDAIPNVSTEKENNTETAKESKPHTDELNKLEKRKTNIIKTIEVENSHIDVDFYDNGEIDGDTVSVYYNGQLILSRKKLTDRPLHMVLDMDDDVEVNELVMYAENLGTIPPNSAVMVIRDGPNRYEVRISSDLNNSGVVRFKHHRVQNK